MQIKQAWMTVALVATLAGAGRAFATDDLTKHPGYVDFDNIVKLFGKQETNVEVFLEPAMLQFIGKMASGDPEMAALCAKLLQIRVQSFQMDSDKVDAVEKTVADAAQKLEGQGWGPLIKVRDRKGGSQTYVYMKLVNGKSQGMTVMNIDPHDEATFVNIVGEIDPEQIGRLSRTIHIDQLDSLRMNMHGKNYDRSDDKSDDKADDKKPVKK